MRAKKAAEKLVETKFTDDVVQQKSKLKAVSYRNISAIFICFLNFSFAIPCFAHFTACLIANRIRICVVTT